MRRLPFVSPQRHLADGLACALPFQVALLSRPATLQGGEVGRRGGARRVAEVQRRPVLMVALLGTDPELGSRPLLVVLARTRSVVTRHDSENGVKVHTVSDQF